MLPFLCPSHHALSSARAWAPALPLCPVLTDHRAALRVRPPSAAEPDPLRAFAPKCRCSPTTGPPAAPPGAAQTSRTADQGEGNWAGEVVRGCLTGPVGAERRREAWKGRGLADRCEDVVPGAKSCTATRVPAPSPPRPILHPTLQRGLSEDVFHPQRPAKPSEKPRLRQIPSAEDLETDGGVAGPLGDDSLEHREAGRGQHEARGPVALQQHQQVQRGLCVPSEGVVRGCWAWHGWKGGR